VNIASVIAIVFGVICIFASQIIDGASIGILIQPSAFFIVLGGTFCAALVNFNLATLVSAFRSAKEVFTTPPPIAVIDEIVQIAYYARKNSLITLDGMLDKVSDSFLARGLQMVIDLGNPQLIYDILSSEIAYEEEEELIHSRVFEALGGYAPTFGIVGAVLGLIQVVQNLSNIDLLGIGIATAFVSTLYGVGFANLIFLPIAGNLKQKTRERILLKEVILQGIMSIALQENPTIIEEKLLAYIKFHNKPQRVKYAG